MHTHRGIYCICIDEIGRLLTIEKTGGPYKNRLDLPGGTPEEEESELETVQREVLEETGYTLLSAEKIGEKGYVLPWVYKNWTQSHHTAVYFFGQINENCSPQPLAVNGDQDSKGALWFHPDELKEDWCSPLVWEAVQYIGNQHLSQEAKTYESWKVVTKPLYPN